MPLPGRRKGKRRGDYWQQISAKPGTPAKVPCPMSAELLPGGWGAGLALKKSYQIIRLDNSTREQGPPRHEVLLFGAFGRRRPRPGSWPKGMGTSPVGGTCYPPQPWVTAEWGPA